jgi:PAS domain S-box-containing protein
MLKPGGEIPGTATVSAHCYGTPSGRFLSVSIEHHSKSATPGRSRRPARTSKVIPGELEAHHYENLVQSVVDYAIYMLGPEGEVASWNRGAERIKGYSPDEIIGRNFSEFYTEEDRAKGLPQRGLAIAAREGRFENEGWRVRKDGTRFWASVVIDAIRDEDGELVGFAKLTRDVTDRREAQIRLDQTRDQLFQSQKMEALGQLTGGLAHDFNNLLTAIISAAELALRKREDPEKLENMLRAVVSSAQRGGALTRQLLAFARRQPLETKVVDLRKDLPEVASLVRHTISPEIELVTEISDQLWRLEADPGQLQLALLNLAFNARDAMPNGGTLRISAANVELDGEPENLHGPHVAITISDTGTGIPDEIRTRVFEPFFTTKSFGKGTGLGLSQVYGFALQSKGGLTLESAENRGTSITIFLPASNRSPTPHAKRVTLAGKARVLIVEDDAVVAELAGALLHELGYESATVNSGREALARLARDTDFDLVFADIIMPGGISGLELARKIRERFPELPILLTTGFSEAAADETVEFPLISKPYDFEALKIILAELLPQAASATA